MLSQPVAARLLPPIWMMALTVSGANIGMALLSPAIPQLRDDLQATADQAQLVLSVFLIMMGIGQMVAGSLSDRFGRRPILLLGSFLFTLSGFGALIAPTIEVLIGFRAIQGFGAAACMAMGRVIINDSFERAEAGKQMSTITMVQAVVPLLSFAFGGLLADLVGWRGSIGIMVLTAGLIFTVNLLLLKETRKDRVPAAPLLQTLGVFVLLIRTPKFISHATNGGMMTGSFFAMGGYMPYQFQRLGMSAFEFGLLFSTTALGYMIGNSLSRYFGPRFGLDVTAFVGAFFSLIIMAGLVLIQLVGLAGVWEISGMLLVYGVANGLVVANSIIGAVRAAGIHSGAATGLSGALQMLCSAVFGSLIIALGGDTSFFLALNITLGMTAIATLGGYLALDRGNKQADTAY